MKTPLRLRRTMRHPATALYVPGDAHHLLSLCARLGGNTFPVVHRVADGFVVRLTTPSEDAWPGAIALRSLSDNLLVPADAELTPTLLDDEATALTRRRGLLFLPGDRVLAFDAQRHITPAELLAIPRLPHRPWRPLPDRPHQPQELRELHLDRNDPSVEVILDQGGKGIGEETPRPPSAGLLGTLSGHTLTGLGQALGWLGGQLRWSKLVKLGADLIHKGVEQAPRISESLLSRQEAALRDLLRRFREGKIEEALRRALPLGGPVGRGSVIDQGAHLPLHNLFYRLADLLGSSSGPASVWLGNTDVQAELALEYARAAEEATRRGDHRRAAFIYARLLNDHRQAAAVLARGGLHHDAAILYLEKMGDHLAAAQQFELAGEIDRALALYRLKGEHVLAGDLLRRAGEPERAIEEYRAAAEIEVARDNYLAAGELLLYRAGRADLGEHYLAAGWQRRPHGTALGCLLRLADLYAERETPAALLELLDQADHFFDQHPAQQQASRFYNAIARLAGRDNLAGVRDDLRDRALTCLAGFLRRGRGSVNDLLATGGVWDPALIRDADHAVRQVHAPPPRQRVLQRQLVQRRQMTAACVAGATGEVFLGFVSGAVSRFDPRSGDVTHFSQREGAVLALGVDPQGRWLVALRKGGHQTFELSSYDLSGSPQVCQRATLHAEVIPRLTPVAPGPGRGMVGVWDGKYLHYRVIPDLVGEGRLTTSSAFLTALILDGQSYLKALHSTLVVEPEQISYLLSIREEIHEMPLPWKVRVPALAGLPVLSWLPPRQGHMELAGVTKAGGVGWLMFDPFTDAREASASGQLNVASFHAATLLGPGLVAGVADQGVFLVRMGQGRPRPVLERVEVGEVVACFASPGTDELVLLGPTGEVIRLSVDV